MAKTSINRHAGTTRDCRWCLGVVFQVKSSGSVSGRRANFVLLYQNPAAQLEEFSTRAHRPDSGRENAVKLVEKPLPAEEFGRLPEGSPFEAIPQSGSIKLQVRRSVLLRTKVDVYRTAIVDEAVCDIVQFTPREVSIIGRSMGQTHVNRWADDLLRRIQGGQIDPSFVITHRVGLAEGPGMYKTFRDKQDGCVKVVLRP